MHHPSVTGMLSKGCAHERAGEYGRQLRVAWRAGGRGGGRRGEANPVAHVLPASFFSSTSCATTRRSLGALEQKPSTVSG
jgi:hypothetical protein